MKIRTQGDSMFPTLVDGALYEIEPLYEQTVYIGDIIVYCVDNLTICHRVIDIRRSKSRKLFIKTQGDHNPDPDPYVVTLDMIVGKINNSTNVL